ncbi:MAG: carboxypeptidase-like regulatory domain-containing protein [Pirellulales bacterium]|nr:carboxypeptidase-like regulatory domain-containing protein [Pirellulales bacterium]
MTCSLRRAGLAFGLVAAVYLSGCGSDAPKITTVPVTGKVTYNGQPVEGATVAFIPNNPDGRPARGTTDAQGVYTLVTYLGPNDQPSGAEPGEYKVTIEKTQVAPGSALPGKPAEGTDPTEMMQKQFDMSKMKTENEAEMRQKMMGGEGISPMQQPEMQDLIPAKYKNPNSSGLTASVGPSGGTFDFALTD